MESLENAKKDVDELYQEFDSKSLSSPTARDLMEVIDDIDQAYNSLEKYLVSPTKKA